MGKFFFALILTGLALPALPETDYLNRFFVYFDMRDEAGMESTLKEWAAAQPNEAEMFSSYGEYYECRALKGKAAQSWTNAMRQDPSRLDFYLRLARLYQGMGNFEAQYSTLADALQYADRHPLKLKWEGKQVLPLPSGEFLPPILQGFMTHYLKQHNVESNEKALRLARLAVTFFPDHPYAYNCMAAYYFGRQDWPRTLKSLLQANIKAPRDSLVVRNIANTLLTMGKLREAKIFYRRVVDLNNDEKNVAAAKMRLEELAVLKNFENPKELSQASIILHKIGG